MEIRACHRHGCQSLNYEREIERLQDLLVRWLNGGDATLGEDSREAIKSKQSLSEG